MIHYLTKSINLLTLIFFSKRLLYNGFKEKISSQLTEAHKSVVIPSPI
ncbi:MAG: hypothetical protein Ct9H90mP2_01610 [Dehalococcoidia bacterium]|nr:MAG: hypothetical protein Ct9H90mP2_01610 [Dehalococcoidia bacterium]